MQARAWCFQRNGPAAIALCVEHLPQQLGGLSDAIDAEGKRRYASVLLQLLDDPSHFGL